jgi:hypothetical protein
MSLITHDELAELTDCKRAADQIAWLRARGWRFEIGVSGRPKVDRAEYDRRMIGGHHEEPAKGPDTRWYGQETSSSQKSA